MKSRFHSRHNSVYLVMVVFAALSFGVAAKAWSAETNTGRIVQFREPHPKRYVLIGPVGTRATARDGQSWMRARLESGDTNTVEIGSRVVLELAPGTDLDSVLTNRNLALSRTVRSNLFILQAADSQAAIDAAEALAGQKGVSASAPVMRRALKPHNAYATAPTDPYFASQWHLEDRASDGNLAGPDLDVRAAWPATQGKGVTVAVADTGFQLDHPDLASRVTGGPHYNFFEGTSDGSPYDSNANHGTSVAGLIAAEANNSRGVAGVAPQANLASWVIFGTSLGEESVATDEQLMDMFQYASNRVAVQNHSWGSATFAQQEISSLEDNGIANAVSLGRGGKGVVMVRSAGNSREDMANANDDGYACDPRVIAVAAVRKDGRACTYSNPGACVLAGAPSGDLVDSDGDGLVDTQDPDEPGVYTTDRTGSAGYSTSTTEAGDYYSDFNGTSASSPQVAGVAALVLAANTNLAARDVQQIILLSSRHFDLADPDVKTNGAGLRFSHNVGFGVPDAGTAVDLARNWTNRPARTRVSFTNSTTTAIPDDALRVVCAGTGISSTLTNIRCLPSLGPHPDGGTAALPLVYVGQANEELTVDLHGKAALIQRGSSYFYEKIGRAARAGAPFAVIFNNTGTTAIQLMGATGYVPIPAVSIGKTDGEALRDFVATNTTAAAKLHLTPVVRKFTVASTLQCEHVGVRLKTTHTSRQDVRVTLVSPMGTRSNLQAINADDSAGPSDWTYWSVAHFYESSAGTWQLEVSDEQNTTLAGTSTPATGSVTYAELIITGVTITDTDYDGLSDAWEQKYFGSLSYTAKDDPDADGFNNAREQIMGTDPAQSNTAFLLDFAQWNPGYWRLSWPARETATYSVLAGDGVSSSWTVLTNRTGSLPNAEYVVSSTNNQRFFRVIRE